MKKNYTDITVVLDRSGSMMGTKSDTIGGFNAFLQEQKKVEGEATFTLIQFANTYEVTVNGANIQNVAELNETSYQPTGSSTSLLDALGKAINETGERLRRLAESKRPENVVFVVITDGQENSSREFKKATINEMIQHQTDKYKWEFVFLGANQDAISEGASLGVRTANSLTYTQDSAGIGAMYSSVTSNLVNLRKGVAESMAFTEEDRKKQQPVGEKLSRTSKS